MCGGICGPAGEINEGRDSYYKTPSKPIKQRKVPYKNHNGTVLASYEGIRAFVEMYKSKTGGGYMVSWHVGLSSGAASYSKKSNAIREFNNKVPDKYKIKC